MVIMTHGMEFECKYERNTRSSNLVIRIPKEVELIYHQIDMLVHNCIVGVLNLRTLVTDECVCFSYDVTSKLTLEKYFTLKKLKRDELLNILVNITSPLKFCDGYLLYDRCFVMDEKYIFIDPATLRTYLVYVPADNEEDFVENYRELILRIVARLARLEENPSDGNYIQRIIDSLKSEAFSIKEFRELLNSLLGKDRQEELQEERYPLGSDWIDDDGGVMSSYERVVKDNDLYYLTKGREENIPEEKSKSAAIGPKIIAEVMLQVFFTVLFFTVYQMVRASGRESTVLAGTILVLAGLDVLISKSILGSNFFRELREYIGERLSRKQESSQRAATKRRTIKSSVKDQKEDLLEQEQHTEVLAGTKSGLPALKGCGEKNHEVIPLVKNPLVIGRLGEMVDFVLKNNTVGKVHAEIVSRDGKYYIKDLNSRNGTYINGERLESNTDYPVRNGDRVALANNEFVFTIP